MEGEVLHDDIGIHKGNQYFSVYEMYINVNTHLATIIIYIDINDHLLQHFFIFSNHMKQVLIKTPLSQQLKSVIV